MKLFFRLQSANFCSFLSDSFHIVLHGGSICPTLQTANMHMFTCCSSCLRLFKTKLLACVCYHCFGSDLFYSDVSRSCGPLGAVDGRFESSWENKGVFDDIPRGVMYDMYVVSVCSRWLLEGLFEFVFIWRAQYIFLYSSHSCIKQNISCCINLNH